MLLPSSCRKVCHPAQAQPFQGTCRKISINIQGAETWAWPWGHLGALHGLEEGYSGQTLPCWWGEGERSRAEVTSALNSRQLGEHGSVLRQMGLISLLFKKKTNKQLFRKIFIGILVTCAAQQRRGALQLVNHTPPCAGCVCKCICNHTPVVFPCMDCLSAFLLGKKSLSVLLSPLKYQSTAPNRI